MALQDGKIKIKKDIVDQIIQSKEEFDEEYKEQIQEWKAAQKGNK